MDRFVFWILFVGGLTSILAGRVYTFHDTEGEALVNGWPFWLAGAALIGIFSWRYIYRSEKTEQGVKDD